jgi:hypothetical protein
MYAITTDVSKEIHKLRIILETKLTNAAIPPVKRKITN